LDDLPQLETILGHSFQRPELLLQALTHSSFSHEVVAPSPEPGALETPAVLYNEQLEFLGDAVLGFVVSARLVELFPDATEGRLSKIKAHLVSARYLFSVAAGVDLGRFLRLGRGEEKSGGRGKRALLVDALEALIAALYLDGGINVAGDFIRRVVIGDVLTEGAEQFPVQDFKSALQERTQARGLPQGLRHRGHGGRSDDRFRGRIGQEIRRASGGASRVGRLAAARVGAEQRRRGMIS